MQKPPKTFADYLVVAISPVLIMLLVGSLAFFLIQVFYSNEVIPGVRWVMFWFVLAIVLVARIGIEQSKEHAMFYGVALAIVTWIYLIYTHTDPIKGALVLAVTWWCAHKLTVDCTLIKEEEDASGEGVLLNFLQVLEKSLEPPGRPTLPPSPPPKIPTSINLLRKPKPARAPGRWVVYFSLAALPLFGFGQLLLPADPEARRTGFEFLALYLAAGLSLLITTSFLGMRRYLRQRFVEMSRPIAVGWMRFGVLLMATVMILALVLPRPGAKSARKILNHQLAYKKHQASDHALPFNPPGEGPGTPTDRPTEHTGTGVDSTHGTSEAGTHDSQNPGNHSTTPGNSGQSGQAGSGGQSGQGGQSGGGGDSGGGGNDGGSGNGSPPQGVQRPPNVKLPNGTDSGGGNAPVKAPDDGITPHDSGQSARNGNSGTRGNGGGNGNASPPEGTGQRPPNVNLPNGADSGSGNSTGKANDDGKERQDGNGNGQSGSGQADTKPQPQKTPEQKSTIPQPEQKPAPQPQPQTPEPHHIDWQQLIRILFFVVLAALFVWAVIRYRKAIAHAVRSLIAAVREFFRTLFSRRQRKTDLTDNAAPAVLPPQPFATFENPFLTGKDKSWPPERLILYTYEAVRAWAKEYRIEIRPQETPREFCMRLAGRFPDLGPELELFSYFYGYAAFAEGLPEDFEAGSIHRLWQYMGDSVMAVSS